MKKIIFIAISAFLSLAAIAQYTLTDDDAIVQDGTITSVTLTVDTSDIVIPNVLDGQAIWGIKRRACNNSGLKSVDLSLCNELTFIGPEAFLNNPDLTEITLPDVSGIPGYTGWLKNGKDRLTTNTITDFSALYHVPIPHTLTDDDVRVTNGYIDTCTYNYRFKDIIIPGRLDGQEIKGISGAFQYSASGVFNYKDITSIDLTACTALEYIGSYAFSQNLITQLDLSNCTALKEINNASFNGNKIAKINFGSNNNLKVIERSCFSYNQISELDLSGLTNLEYLGLTAFYDNQITNIIFPASSNMKSIGSSCFDYNQLTTIDLSPMTNLKAIYSGAFANNQLTELNLNTLKQLELIGANAFSANPLTSVTLSLCSNLKRIDKKAFSNTQLTNIVLPAPAEYGWKAGYSNDEFITDLTVSDLQSFYWLYSPYTLTDADVIVQNGIIKRCFYNYEKTDIIIPGTLDGQTITGIGERVFERTGITSIDLSDCSGLTLISNRAFMDNNLAHINLSYNTLLEKLGFRSFTGNRISSMNLSGLNRLQSIEDEAFSYNYGDTINIVDLSNLTALKNIGAGVFFPIQIKEVNLSNCSSLERIGRTGFGATGVKKVDFTGCSGVKTIDNHAFILHYMDTLDLSPCSSLEKIGGYAFLRAVQAESHINLNGCVDLKEIGESAFCDNIMPKIDISSCTSLVKVMNRFTWPSYSGTFELPIPSISGVTFNHWSEEIVDYNGITSIDTLHDLSMAQDGLFNYKAKFSSPIISIEKLHAYWNYYATTDLFLRHYMDSATIELQITNHSTLPVTIDSITTPTHFYVDWNSGVIPADTAINITLTFSANEPGYYHGKLIAYGEALQGLTEVFVSAASYMWHTVNFIDWDSSLIKKQSVHDGFWATAPEDPVRECYTFIGWDRTFDTITENITVTALYEENNSCNDTTITRTVTESLETVQFKMYPVPAKDHINIINSTTNNSILIYNSSGLLMRKVLSYEYETNIDISDFPAGLYIVNVNGSSKTLIIN